MKKIIITNLFLLLFFEMSSQTLPTLSMGEVYDWAVNDSFVYRDTIRKSTGQVNQTTVRKTLYVILSRKERRDELTYIRSVEFDNKYTVVQSDGLFLVDESTHQVLKDTVSFVTNDSLTHGYRTCSFPTMWRGDNCFVRNLETRESTTFPSRIETAFTYSNSVLYTYSPQNYWYLSGVGLVKYNYRELFQFDSYKATSLVYYNKRGEVWGIPYETSFAPFYELLSFTPRWVRNSVNLNWQTKFENLMTRFEIERSRDTLNWVTIGEQRATNTFSTASYSIVDRNPLRENSFYRLKIIDNQNKVTYSKIQKVNRLLDVQTVRTIWVYPNPIQEQLSIQYLGQNYSYKIVDVLGKTILSGEHSDVLNLSTALWNKGVYFITINNSETGEVETKTLVKQ